MVPARNDSSSIAAVEEEVDDDDEEEEKGEEGMVIGTVVSAFVPTRMAGFSCDLGTRHAKCLITA